MNQFQGFDQKGTLPTGILKPRATISASGVAVAPKTTAQVDPIKFQLRPTAGRPGDNWVNKDKDKEAALEYQRRQLALQESQAGGGGGGSIICTRFYELGYMDVYSYALDDAFGEVLRVYEPELIDWYARHAPKVVRLMRRDGWFVRWLWRHFGKPWSDHMKHQMNPCLPDNKRGELLMNIGRFLCKL